MDLADALGLREGLAQAAEFGGGEESLSRLLLVLVDVPAGVRAVRPQSPSFRQVHHLREDGDRPVRLLGRLPMGMVHDTNVGSGDVGGLRGAEEGQDDEA